MKAMAKAIFNPSPVEGKDFSTLRYGRSVLLAGYEKRRMSGTSFATPIAAGIAAIVMDYVAQKSQGYFGKDKYVANRSRLGMTLWLFLRSIYAVRGRDSSFLHHGVFSLGDGEAKLT